MTAEGNVNNELIGVPTEDGVKNVHPEVMKEYLQQAFEQFRKQDGVKGELKLIAEAVEEGTGIKKAVFSKWAKAAYKAETRKTKTLAATFEALDAVVPEV